MILFSILLLCLGLALVIVSADEAIKRLLNLARYLHLSEFVISFVLAGVIAILPELSIGVLAAVEGSSSLGFGVILGANIADLTLVIGVVVLTTGKVRLDASVMKSVRVSLLAVVLPVLLFFDGEISRLDGVILVVSFMVYVFTLLRTKHDVAAFTGIRSRRRVTFEVAVLVASLVLLFVGGSLITDNSQALSLALGLPLFIVGLVVALEPVCRRWCLLSGPAAKCIVDSD
jgi:cation:H+ antiporter